MGFFFRKTIGLGSGFRLNLSKSGLGLSAGIKGARVGIGPRGPYVSAAKDGIYYRKHLGGATHTSSTPHTPGKYEAALLLVLTLVVLVFALAGGFVAWALSR